MDLLKVIKTILSPILIVTDAAEAIVLLFFLVGLVICIPVGLYHIYQLSLEKYLWLFVLISVVFSCVLTFSIRQMRVGKMSKTNFWGNVLVIAVAGFGGLGMFLTAVQA
jgi:uncharacterized membrane protein YiaA